MRVFYPKDAITLPASPPHPPGTEYKVSVGEEDWDGTFRTVLKVQMVYNGAVSGRRAPSYPLGTDDFERVQTAARNLLARYQQEGVGRLG